ncbi:hypothetical protein [Streptomyces sp. NPDC017529]|uniref:hypothetical protein n=1 Tax=Streptomyces sp. NPDC017529 TaxID=3365000 RepID=UPI00379FB9C8
MKMTTKVTVPLTAMVLAAGAGTVYFLADDAGTRNPAQSVAAPASASEAHVAQASVGDPHDPATWRLPIEAYMPTRAQARLVSTSRDTLIDRCMDKAGYPAWKPAPDLPQVGGKTLTDWRYGIHDATLAAERGYHPEAGEQEAYDAAMSEGAVDESGAPDDVVKRCVSQADGSVPAAQPADVLQQVSGEAFNESRTDPKVVAAFTKWSSCMKTKGYSYKAPMEANDDPAFADPHKVSKQEVKTAQADITCRDEADVARTWFDAEAKLQRSKIAEHLQAISKSAEATKQAVAKAKAV